MYCLENCMFRPAQNKVYTTGIMLKGTFTHVLSTLAVGKHFEGKEMLESILKLAAFLIFWSALGIYKETFTLYR